MFSSRAQREDLPLQQHDQRDNSAETPISPDEFGEQTARRVLGPAAVVGASAALAGFTAQTLLELHPFRPLTLAAYLSLLSLGCWWWRRPPRNAQLGLLFISAFLLSGIGWFVLQGATSALVHLGIVSCAGYYLLTKLRYALAQQVISLAWVVAAVYRDNTELVWSLAIAYVLTCLAGVFLYVVRQQVLLDFGRMRQRLDRVYQEREQARERAAKAEKLESLGVMAGGVAHDFNNLLVGIVGGVDLAIANEQRSDRRRSALEQIRVSAETAQTLCQELLDVSGGRPLSREPLSFPGLLDASLALVRSAREVGAAQIDVRIEAELPPVFGDRGRLLQLCQNLLNNALDAVGSRGGRVTVGLERDPADPARLLLYVEDDGPGVPETDKGRIFDPFFSTKFAGRGLGLATVASVAKGHDGTIDLLDRQPGARFEIRLPVSQEPIRGSVSSATSPNRRYSGQMLVVDDDFGVRKIASQMAEQLGFTATAVDSGEAALQCLGQEEPALLLVDATMPGLSGFETIAAARERWPLLPIILSSGYSLDDAGAQRLPDDIPFLPKPFSLRDLRKAVDAARGSTSLLSDGAAYVEHR